LSVEFSRLLQSLTDSPFGVRLVALTAAESETVVEYPVGAVTAGRWNEVARMNNRVEISFGSE